MSARRCLALCAVLVVCGLMTGASTGVAAQAKQVRIAFWESKAESVDKVLDAYMAQFMKAHPNVAVTRSHYGTEDLRNQFQAACLAGVGPALILAPNDWAGLFSTMGIVKRADEVTDLSIYMDNCLQLTNVDGAIWGVPVSVGSHYMLMYNKALVKNPPQTTDELVAIAKDATKGDVKGFGYWFNAPYYHAAWMSGYGGWPLEGHKPALGTEAMVKALTLVADMIFKHKVLPRSMEPAEADSLFKEGRLAMTISGDWSLASFKEALGEKLGVARLPKVSETGIWPTAMFGGDFFFANAALSGQELQAVKDFVAFFGTQEVQVGLFQQTMKYPVTKEAFAEVGATRDPLVAKSVEILKTARAMPAHAEMRAAWDAMYAGLAAAFSGEMTPQQAARFMQEEAEKKIKELGK